MSEPVVTESNTTPPDIVETHISTVMFVGERAFKLLKPVRTGFLDHRDVAGRMRAVTAELELNSRMAPDVYLGAVDVLEHGQPRDRMLVMRRLPDDRRLSTLCEQPDFADHLRRVAHTIAAFHAGLPPIERPVPMSTADGLAALWRSSFEELVPSVGSVIDPAEFEQVRALAFDYLRHAGPLFERRRQLGHVRDGHGDLIADDIFMLDDGPRILDCLAFDDGYRISDVLADIAFLVMDVERLAGPSAATALMRWYCEFSGEHHPATLAHHYVAYRAHVRAKVAVLRHRQRQLVEDADAARTHHRQTLDHLRRAQLQVVLLGGGPGSGKTTTANAIAERLNWAVIDTDTLRKDLHGIDHDDHDVHHHPELYSAPATATTYQALVDQAAELLQSGTCVVVDATWADAEHRRLIRAVASDRGATVHEFRCELAPSIAQQRIEVRRSVDLDASDATPPLVNAFRSDPWPEAVRLDTDRPTAEAVDEAVSVLFGRPRPAVFETDLA